MRDCYGEFPLTCVAGGDRTSSRKAGVDVRTAMSVVNGGVRVLKSIRWGRTIAVAVALLFIMAGIYATVAVFRRHAVVDFVSFWAAARLTLVGSAATAYNILAHNAVEQTVQNLGGLKLP